MKKLITLMLLSTSLVHANIIPVDNSIGLVTDELFSYQWGLLNQGQTLVREKDDIHNLPMAGVINKDIGWKSLVGTFSERRPIVAVLDSGVDLNHPELQGNLWKNEDECGKDASKDNDGNQLAGDCHGWNFTEAMDSESAKDPGDTDGHGTHISGIIAALNNGTGMVGVTPNALIMPIKVMRDSNSTSNVPSSEAFARGIIYAVDNGADVINMSLGWPRSLETKALRDAVYYALGRGVPIVAAAGNNNSSEPLYPCAYDGVICVGATTINGDFAGFSNFGGHVDTLAPGEGILGLHPTLFEPDFFAVPGFELRSGTSQSAPMVAGMIAALKAKNKDITIDELFAKLYQAKAVKHSTKYVLGGNASWDLLNAEITAPVLRPIFKKVRQIVFKGLDPVSKVPVTIRNFGLLASDVLVKVESLSSAIEFSSESQMIPALKQGEFRDLLFDVKVKDFAGEAQVGFKITIENNGQSYSYSNEVPVVRDLRADENFKKSTFSFSDKVLPIGAVREAGIVPLISTLEAWDSSKHEFFMRKTLKDEKRIELTIFSREGSQFIQKRKNIVIENAINLVSFVRVDLNRDGKEDYLVHALAEKDNKKFFVFGFYDSELNDLWSGFQNVSLNLDLYVESLNDLFFIKHEDAKLGKMLVPAFFTSGMLPKVDQPITSWERYDVDRKNRLYYLEPFENSLRIRSLTTKTWEEALKKELKSKWYETVDTEQLLPPSLDDKKNGVLRALVSVGMATKRQLFIYTFDAKRNVHGAKLPQLVLQADSVDPLWSLSNEGINAHGEVFFNIYDRTRSKLVATRDDKQIGEYIFRHETEADLVAGHIASFDQNESRFSVFQTREELIAVTTGASEQRSARPKLRYSFLSQKLLSEMYFPVSYKRDGLHRPALYVDGTSVTGNRVYLFEEQKGELVSSIRNSLVIPNNCRALNPNFNRDVETYEFVFLCLEEKEFLIRTYEMN